ncbi:hypothetical protein BMAGN_1158, partial [Bifidobacterium magnum]
MHIPTLKRMATTLTAALAGAAMLAGLSACGPDASTPSAERRLVGEYGHVKHARILDVLQGTSLGRGRGLRPRGAFRARCGRVGTACGQSRE